MRAIGRTRTFAFRGGAISVLVFALVLVAGCRKLPLLSAEAPAHTPSPRAPADHVKNRKGALHKKGAKDAVVNCTPCHGKDLKGAPPHPSCYSCHDKTWR